MQKRALVLVVAFVALDAWVLVDAAARRSAHPGRSSTHAVVRLVGTADLVLSTNARWLRHPSQVEPWAAVMDQPASLDTEPAGMVIGPPVGLYDAPPVSEAAE
jgi:hypothetical protein